MLLMYHIFSFLPSSSLGCHSPSSLLPRPSCPFLLFLSSICFLFPSLHLCIILYSSHPISPPWRPGLPVLSLHQEPLTSAGCGAKVVPLSLPAEYGSLCSECLNIKERRGEEATKERRRGDEGTKERGEDMW